eukprot:jgi/Bigna1/92630/estExt_fgenesh1_pm.C_440016
MRQTVFICRVYRAVACGHHSCAIPPPFRNQEARVIDTMKTTTIASLALNIVLAAVVLVALLGRTQQHEQDVGMMMVRAPAATGLAAPCTGSRTAVNFHRRFKFQPRRKPDPPRKWSMKVGDKVKVISGGDKGKESEITRVYRKSGYVLVKDVNLKTKHQRPQGEDETGAIIQIEHPIHHSNVKVTERSVYTKPVAAVATE